MAEKKFDALSAVRTHTSGNTKPVEASQQPSAPVQNAPTSTPQSNQSQTGQKAPATGSGGRVTNTGTVYLDTNAKDAQGNPIKAQYVNGVLQTTLPDGTVVHTNGGDYVYKKPSDPTVNIQKNKVPTSYYGKSTLDAWLKAAQQQATQAADYATQQGIKELTRAEEDAQAQFQTQRNQIDIDEAKAKDNQALYAEARGDKGGIGAAQYDSIMNTAANNRLQVQKAQTQLSTDTARQIADLRAQGEFEKADALLELTQTYLSQLISMEQFALNYSLSAAQFNASLDQWAEEYKLKVADLTGVYNGGLTLQGQQMQWQQSEAVRTQNANTGAALLEAGVMPSPVQLQAMNMSESEAQAMIDAKNAADAKQSALTQVELSLNAGYPPSEELCKTAKLDYTTIKGIHDTMTAKEADKTASSKAETQLTALINEGKAGAITEDMCKTAGWDYNTAVTLAQAAAERLAAKSKGSGGGGGGNPGKTPTGISYEDIYVLSGGDLSRVNNILHNAGYSDGEAQTEIGYYEDWLEKQKTAGANDRYFADIKNNCAQMKKSGKTDEEVYAYLGRVTLSDIQWIEMAGYLPTIGVKDTN